MYSLSAVERNLKTHTPSRVMGQFMAIVCPLKAGAIHPKWPQGSAQGKNF